MNEDFTKAIRKRSILPFFTKIGKKVDSYLFTDKGKTADCQALGIVTTAIEIKFTAFG